MSPVNDHDESLSTLAVEVQGQLCRSKASLRTLAALLECYGDQGPNAAGYIDPPNLIAGLAALLGATADGIEQPEASAGTIEVALRDFETHPPLGAVVTGHHVERSSVHQ